MDGKKLSREKQIEIVERYFRNSRPFFLTGGALGE